MEPAGHGSLLGGMHCYICRGRLDPNSKLRHAVPSSCHMQSIQGVLCSINRRTSRDTDGGRGVDGPGVGKGIQCNAIHRIFRHQPRLSRGHELAPRI